MYRKRERGSKKLQRMRSARERLRVDGPAPEYPAELPELRRSIIVVDHDFGTVVHRIDCYRTNRADCYRAVADGVIWHERIGWSKVLEGLRKSFVRVGAR